MSNQRGPQCYINEFSDDENEVVHSLTNDEHSVLTLKQRNSVHSRNSNLSSNDDENIVEDEPLLTRTASCPNLNVSYYCMNNCSGLFSS